MTIREKSLLTIRSALKECDRHLQWLLHGHEKLRGIFPLDHESMKCLEADTVTHLDQFIYRFTKLQDSMGTRLLPSLYAHLQDSAVSVPFLDILTELEKFGAIPSEHDWQFFRNLRNNLAHDYPESAEQTVFTLNTLFSNWERLQALYTKTRQYCLSRDIVE